MAVDVETSIEIDCPRIVVAAFVSNPDNATRWYVNIKSIAWEARPPAVVGSHSRRSSSVVDSPTPMKSGRSSRMSDS